MPMTKGRSQAMLSEREQQDASSVRVLLRSFIPRFRMRCWGGFVPQPSICVVWTWSVFLLRGVAPRLHGKSLRQNCFPRLIHNRMWETLRWGCHPRVSVRVSSRQVCSPLHGEKALRHGRRASCGRTCRTVQLSFRFENCGEGSFEKMASRKLEVQKL